MVCNEGGCTAPVTVQNGFVPALDEISALAGKPVTRLTENEVLAVGYCEDCAAIHGMCGGKKLFSASRALAEIEKQQKAANHAAVRQTLGAAFVAAGFQAK
jgi:hypothetical protein